MRSLSIAVALGLVASWASAQVVVSTPRGIVVAHDGVVELYGKAGGPPRWRVDGVAAPQRIITSDSRVAVLDSLANEVRIIELEDGSATTWRTSDTPIDGVFVFDSLYVVERDARAVERIEPDGGRRSITTPPDPAYLRANGSSLYLYSRVNGLLQQITLVPFAVRREAHVAPFASDMEVDGTTAYLVYPREAKVRAIGLDTMKPAGEWQVGVVPVDLSLAGGGSALTARLLAVADPSSKRVWMIEGAQSIARAFTRGFLRGLLGLGLFGNRTSKFATGIDRVMAEHAPWVAYDSATATLYRFTKSNSSVLANGISPHGFAVSSNGVFWWANGTLVAQRR